MSKFRTLTSEKGIVYVTHWCEGCHSEHTLPAERWHWNGCIIRPTLSPFVKHFIRDGNGREHTVCHYFIKEGKIQYCGDCSHKYAGQTMDLMDVKE